MRFLGQIQIPVHENESFTKAEVEDLEKPGLNESAIRGDPAISDDN